MPKFNNSDELNSLFGKISSAAVKISKGGHLISAKRVVPEGKNSKPFVSVLHEGKEISSFSPEIHGNFSFDEIRREISKSLVVGE